MHRGLLFTREFLKRGIAETTAWAALIESEVESFRVTARSIFKRFPVSGSPNEATTERDLIFKVLEALGWEDILVQQSTSKRRTDIPDALLLPDAEAKTRANAERDRGGAIQIRRGRPGKQSVAYSARPRWKERRSRALDADLALSLARRGAIGSAYLMGDPDKRSGLAALLPESEVAIRGVLRTRFAASSRDVRAK